MCSEACCSRGLKAAQHAQSIFPCDTGSAGGRRSTQARNSRAALPKPFRSSSRRSVRYSATRRRRQDEACKLSRTTGQLPTAPHAGDDNMKACKLPRTTGQLPSVRCPIPHTSTAGAQSHTKGCVSHRSPRLQAQRWSHCARPLSNTTLSTLELCPLPLNSTDSPLFLLLSQSRLAGIVVAQPRHSPPTRRTQSVRRRRCAHRSAAHIAARVKTP